MEGVNYIFQFSVHAVGSVYLQLLNNVSYEKVSVLGERALNRIIEEVCRPVIAAMGVYRSSGP